MKMIGDRNMEKSGFVFILAACFLLTLSSSVLAVPTLFTVDILSVADVNTREQTSKTFSVQNIEIVDESDVSYTTIWTRDIITLAKDGTVSFILTDYNEGDEVYLAAASAPIYVADSGNSRIQKFDSDGNFLLKWNKGGGLSSPQGIAVDSEGNVYVTGNSRILKFDSDGTFILEWGEQGSGDGQFRGPYGVATDSDGNVYVVDNGNCRIQKFDSDGTFILKWGEQGEDEGQFYYPQGIAVDSENNVYVTDNAYGDTGCSRIQKFDSDGTFILEWGGQVGYGVDYPLGITVDSDDNVYVTDEVSRLYKFDSDGNFILTWSGGGAWSAGRPNDVAVDSEGNVYVSDDGNDKIQKLDSDGNFILDWGVYGSGEGEFVDPLSISVGVGLETFGPILLLPS